MDWDLAVKIVGPLLGTVVGVWVKTWAEKRPRVVAFVQHVGAVRLDSVGDVPAMFVGTHTVVLRNAGGKKAEKLRLGHQQLPAFRITPDIEYSIVPLANGGQEIQIPILIPKKQITITYLYTAPLQWTGVNTHLETDEGAIKVLNVLPTVPPPKWLIAGVWFFALVGIATVLYLLISWMQSTGS